jgi:hypothetical protein
VVEVVELDGPVRVVLRHDEPGLWIYEAWEPVGDRSYTETMEAKEGGAWGRIDTQRFDGEAPKDPAAYLACFITREQERRQAAYRPIIQAFPEAIEGYRSKGLIRMFGNPASVRARLERKGEIEPSGKTQSAPTFAGA